MKRIWISLLLILLALGIAATYILFLKEPHTSTSTKQNHTAPLPTSLNPVVKKKATELIQLAAQKGIHVVITNGFRSVQEQNRLYAQGRTTPGNIVTDAKGGQSYHNYGLAVDFALETPSGNVIWDMQYDGNKNGVPDWTEVADIAKSLGFQWGGDWAQFKDYCHLQMNFGLTIADLQKGKRPNSTLVADNS
jgi:peptidoglycan L-alanyl-D-glutamate endopeptidase CwlK